MLKWASAQIENHGKIRDWISVTFLAILNEDLGIDKLVNEFGVTLEEATILDGYQKKIKR